MNKREVKKVDWDNGDTLNNMFDYLCSRVDWGKAALDSDAICCMNTLFTELQKDKRKFNKDGEVNN